MKLFFLLLAILSCAVASCFAAPVTVEWDDPDNDPALIAADGLHPSAKMYKMWVDKIYNDIKVTLK